MKKMMRFIAILCAFALVFTSVPDLRAAETPDESPAVEESVDKDTVETAGEDAVDEADEVQEEENLEADDEDEAEAADSDQAIESEDSRDEVEAEPAEDEASGDDGEEVIGGKGSDQETVNEKSGDQISAKGSGELQFTLDQTSYVYTGSAIEPVPSNVKADVSGSLVTLTSDQYDVTYANNTDVGKGAQVTVTGKEGSGYEAYSLTQTFEITKAAQTLTVKASKSSLKYGKKGKITVTGAKGKLTYTSSKPKVLKVNSNGTYKGLTTGTATVTVSAAATSNYKAGKETVKITVTGKKLTASNTKIKLSKTTYTYNGKKRKPKVTVKFKGKTLKKGRDYKLTYQNNINAGKATVVVTGIGKYQGNRKKAFKIKKAKNTMKATLSKKYVDLNKTLTLTVKKAIGTVTYTSSNTAVATVSAKGVITGKANGTVTITVKAAGNANYKPLKKKFKVTVGYRSLTSSDCKVTLSNTSYTYNGQEKRPTVTVKYDGTTLKLNKDYTLTYKNNINAGTASIVLKGKGNYINTRTVTFKINKASQTNFYVDTSLRTMKNGNTITIAATGAIGGVTYTSNSPSYLKHMGGGVFKALKKTNNYVTITVTANGNKNYSSKSYSIKVSIN